MREHLPSAPFRRSVRRKGAYTQRPVVLDAVRLHVEALLRHVVRLAAHDVHAKHRRVLQQSHLVAALKRYATSG